MALDKTESASKSKMLASKLFTTQNIIKKKFKKARMNRVQQENDMNYTMKRLTPLPCTIASAISSDSQTKELDITARNHSLKKIISKNRLASKTKLMRTGKTKEYNINALCERLRLLLSSQIANNTINTHEINTILRKLHDLEIFV